MPGARATCGADSTRHLQCRQHALWPAQYRHTVACQAAARAQTAAGEAASSSPPTAPAVATPRRGRPRRVDTSSRPHAPQDVQQLMAATGLSRATAEHIVAARQQAPSIPADARKLCDNVRQLQQLLGARPAERALRRFPSLLSYSPATLALNYQAWQAFFAPEGADNVDAAAAGSTAGSAEASAEQQQASMLRRIVRSPQLLGVDVERQVGNLYEAGVLMQAQDLHDFAFKAMTLGRMRPETLQHKLHTTLAFLNATLQQAQQRAQQQAQAQAQAQEGDADSSSSGSRGGGGGDRSSSGSPELLRVTMEDLQKAARRDFNWLTLNSNTLQQRLTDLHTELQLPWQSVVRMFLQQPSIINRRPALLGPRAAALQQLPGLGRERALAAITGLATLLQLQPETVRARWQQLREAAATHAPWQERLDSMPGVSVAALLIRSQARYERLAHVVALRRQGWHSLERVLSLTDAAYKARVLDGGAQRGPGRPRKHARAPGQQREGDAAVAQ